MNHKHIISDKLFKDSLVLSSSSYIVVKRALTIQRMFLLINITKTHYLLYIEISEILQVARRDVLEVAG